MTEIPKPFGYVSDGGLPRRIFQHEPFTETEQLMYSTAPVYSHGQMREAIAASRKQALEEAAREIEVWKSDYVPTDPMHKCYELLAAAIRSLTPTKGQP